MSNSYLLVPEVAERLDISVRTVYKYIHDEQLPARKIGNKWRVLEDDVNEFLGIAPKPSSTDEK